MTHPAATKPIKVLRSLSTLTFPCGEAPLRIQLPTTPPDPSQWRSKRCPQCKTLFFFRFVPATEAGRITARPVYKLDWRTPVTPIPVTDRTTTNGGAAACEVPSEGTVAGVR